VKTALILTTAVALLAACPVAAADQPAPSTPLPDWRPAAMRAFFSWGLDEAYAMAGPVYPGPKRMPADARRLIGGCDPQARDKPLAVDLLCGFSPAGVFADQADFLAIGHGALPVGFTKADCPAASSLPDFLTGTVLVECVRNSRGAEIDFEHNTDPRIKGEFGISVVMLPHR
jgi:hypothetical protein